MLPRGTLLVSSRYNSIFTLPCFPYLIVKNWCCQIALVSVLVQNVQMSNTFLIPICPLPAHSRMKLPQVAMRNMGCPYWDNNSLPLSKNLEALLLKGRYLLKLNWIRSYSLQSIWTHFAHILKTSVSYKYNTHLSIFKCFLKIMCLEPEKQRSKSDSHSSENINKLIIKESLPYQNRESSCYLLLPSLKFTTWNWIPYSVSSRNGFPGKILILSK